MDSATINNATVSVSDSSILRPGDSVEFAGYSYTTARIFFVNSVTTGMSEVKTASRWRVLAIALRHPILYVKSRRNPMAAIVQECRKHFGLP